MCSSILQDDVNCREDDIHIKVRNTIQKELQNECKVIK